MQGGLTRAAGEDVEVYAITVGTLTAGDNYEMQFEGATLTITKAEPTVTPPTAANGLHYNGSARQLVNAGEAIGGTMQYSLDGQNWSTDIPTGTDVGIYEVWYKVVGDANHNDTAPARVNAAIAFTVPYFSDAALELGGVLNLRFYVTYPENWDTANDRVEFTVNVVPHTVSYDESEEDDTGRYFPCPVAAFQMADLITAVYYHGTDEMDREENYTVKDNLKYLNEHTTGDTQALVRAAMDFGSYIQPYLAACNGWEIGKDHAAVKPFNADLQPMTEVPGEYAHEVSINSKYVKNAVFGLSTYQDNTLEVTVVLKDGVTGDITGTVNGKDVTPTSAGTNAYELTLGNLPSNALATAYNFTLSVSGVEVFNFKASALSYARLVLLPPQSGTPEQKLALTALYNYALAAQKYKPE